MEDDIKVSNGKYVCTIHFYPGITQVSRSALENFLFLKLYTGSIESYIWRDYEHNCYSLKLVGKSLTNILLTRFKIINHFVKTPGE